VVGVGWGGEGGPDGLVADESEKGLLYVAVAVDEEELA
jgi:hypothetical protein